MQTNYLTIEQLGQKCPNIFTEGKSQNRSSKYVHIPTKVIVQDIMDLGWHPVDAKLVKSRDKELGLFKKHLIQFEHPTFTTPDHNVRILLTNSHDGTSNFKLDLGVFRFICSNGLVIKSEDFGSMIIRHMGYSNKDVINAVNEMVIRAPKVLEKIEIMKHITMTDEQMSEFALNSACIRFDKEFKDSEQIKEQVDHMQLLGIVRSEDESNDLWTVYNRIQEKIINGDFQYTNEKNKLRKGRKIKNIDRDLRINQELWQLAEGYVN